MKKSVAVIGLGTFGVELVETLKKLGAEVIAIDINPTRLQSVGNIADHCFVCDSANIRALEEIGVDKVDTAIIAMGQGTPSLLVAGITTTLNLKKLKINNITVRLDDEGYRDIFSEVGATFLFSPLKMASQRLSNVIVDGYQDYFGISDDYSVLQIEVKQKFKDLTLEKLNAPRKYHVIILLIGREGKVFMPTKDDVILENDNIYAFGNKKDADSLAKYLGK